MLPDVERFIDLQKADEQIRRLKDEIAALPRRVSAIEEKLAGTKSRLEATKAAVKGDEANRRKFETAIQDLQGKISKYRDQSLAVKTNEQYKALLHEIQFAEQDIRANEDKILEVMVNAEAREKDVKAAEAELKEETAEIEKEKAVARECTAKDEKELAEWNAKRDQARAGVDADLLRHYDRVSKFRGSGLAEVRDQKCMGCSVMLRPQTINEVRSGGNAVVCDSCQRILYYNPANDVAVEQATSAKRRRARPKDTDQAWYYREAYGELGEVLLSFIKTDDRWRRRSYDFQSGREVGDSISASGSYQSSFATDLETAIRLNGHWNVDEIRDWGGELPSTVIDSLHRDLDAARLEAAASNPAPTASTAAERPVAS
jgi:predicted  nucleic acid-binding Zn-ribbon protein